MENQTQSPSSSPSSARSSPLKGVTPKLFRASTWNGSKREVNDGKASANQDPNFRPNGELESKSLPNVLESEPRSVCKLYKASGIFSSKCECGEQKKHPCHSVSHTCKYCASSFTALANSSVPCKVHRGIPGISVCACKPMSGTDKALSDTLFDLAIRCPLLTFGTVYQ
eukprot:3914059-Rhodomonas_salina.2